MLSDAYDMNYDIEDLYNYFERLSPIYISRNRQKMIFYFCNFRNNIGTFGGALLVNSPDFETSNARPYLIVANCIF